MNINEVGKKLSDIYNLPESEQEEALTSLVNDKDVIDTLKTAFVNLKMVIRNAIEGIAGFISALQKSTTEEWIISQNSDFLLQVAPRCYHLAFNSRKHRVRKKNKARLLKLIEKKEKIWRELHNEKTARICL